MSNPQTRTIRLLRDGPRPFTPAEKSLIRKVHGYMPAQQLLDILNERLLSDLGPEEQRHTMEQLYAEIGSVESAPADGHDWSSLRKLLRKAKRDGILAAITPQVIDDFSVVFSLSPGQALRLKDVLLQGKDDE